MHYCICFLIEIIKKLIIFLTWFHPFFRERNFHLFSRLLRDHFVFGSIGIQCLVVQIFSIPLKSQGYGISIFQPIRLICFDR